MSLNAARLIAALLLIVALIGVYRGFATCLQNLAYLMALPTKNNPMLSYLTTAFSDHVRIREKFGYKVSDAMWDFFKKLEVIDAQGKPTAHFGNPLWVCYQYCLAKGDDRSKNVIYEQGKKAIARKYGIGVFPLPRAMEKTFGIWNPNSKVK